jgi:hypothetical protein
MQIAIALYPGCTALDWIGPHQVFATAETRHASPAASGL